MTARKPSLLRQLLWAATLAAGFGTVWPLLALWLTTAFQETWQGGEPLRQESLLVKSDGTPLIRAVALDSLYTTTFRDLSGGLQDTPEGKDLLPSVSLAGEHEPPGFFSSGPNWEQRLKFFVNAEQNWFFVHDGKPEGAGYFVGYETTSNRRIGFIGLNGFRSDPVPADERIPVRGALVMDYSNWSSVPISMYRGYRWGRSRAFRLEPWDVPPQLVYVACGHRLRLVDLAARTVTTGFEAPEQIEAVGVPAVSSWSGGHAVTEQPILVRTRQQIDALDHKHKIIRVFTIPTEVDRRSSATWYETGNGEAIAEFARPPSIAEPDNVTNHMVYRIGADGTIRDRFEVALQTGSRVTNRARLQLQTLLALPAPALLLVVEPFVVIGFDRIKSDWAVLIAQLMTLWPSLLAAFALATILAVITWRRSRAFGLSKSEQVAWVVFVLLFGLFGFVGFLLGRRWPIRQPCASCHTQVPRDRLVCAQCGTGFPDPSRKGIEIFA